MLKKLKRYRLKIDKSCYSNLLQLRTLKQFFLYFKFSNRIINKINSLKENSIYNTIYKERTTKNEKFKSTVVKKERERKIYSQPIRFDAYTNKTPPKLDRISAIRKARNSLDLCNSDPIRFIIFLFCSFLFFFSLSLFFCC